MLHQISYLVIRKASLILHHISIALKSKDPAHHTVQEIPVMGYSNDNTLEVVQIILQNGQSANIQIIGRLIQKQYIRSIHQNAQQIQTPLLTSGKTADGGVLHTAREQKTLQHLGRADASILRLHILCHVADVVDDLQILIHGLILLGEIADLDRLSDLDGSGIRLNPSGDHLHEGGLSASVRPDDADPVIL